jgi:hypothetical protein
LFKNSEFNHKDQRHPADTAAASFRQRREGSFIPQQIDADRPRPAGNIELYQDFAAANSSTSAHGSTHQPNPCTAILKSNR